MAEDASARLQVAAGSGQPVRVHLRDGEVLVARILGLFHGQFRYVALTSSHPERYGVCDSTGFERGLADVDRVTLLREPS